MRVAYITMHNPRDVTYWSGLGYFIWQSLASRGIEIELIGPLHLSRFNVHCCRLKDRFYKWQHRFYWLDGDASIVRARSRIAARKLAMIPPVDAIFSATILPAAYLPGNVPLVIYSDSTLRRLFDTYPIHAHMAGLNYRHADRIERSAQRRASALVYASEWAAQSARTEYGADPAKVHVVPFGANLEAIPPHDAVAQAIEARERSQLRLLFIGVDWERKGGPAALEVVRQLNRMGIPATLTVIGCEPPLASQDQQFVVRLGFVEKNAAGHAKIQAELSRSHFLIVLSVAECFGIVYCEASANGVPSIARNVGGVPDAVRNGRNGQRFELGDSPALIADWVAANFRDYDRYRKLALSSLKEFETELNWLASGEKLERILRGVISRK